LPTTLTPTKRPVRINVRRLTTLVFASLIGPLAAAILLDFSLGLTPLFTIGAALIFIPLSSLLVVRATLAEFEAVIQSVAPIEPEHQEIE
jgi:hypothetical protein